MKKPNTILREYVSRLSDSEMHDIGQRLSQRLCGDYAEVATTLQRDREIDYWLKSATSASEWFVMIDRIADAINKEQKRREEEVAEVA